VQEVNIIDLVRPITKYAVMIEDATEALYHVQKAIHLATTGRPGPVWVDVPANIQSARADGCAFRQFDPRELPPVAYDQDLREKAQAVAELLKRSKRPLLHLGQGVKMAGAVHDVMRLAEAYQIPFVTARNANQLVDWDHELYVGRPGTFAQRGANFAVQNADVYLAVGTRLSLPQTGYQSKEFARHATKVMVDIDRAELDKPTLAIDIKVHADAKAFLAELSRQLDGAPLQTADWVAQCRRWRAKYPVVLPEHRAQQRPVNSYYFVDVLSDVLTREDVIVTDMGLAFQGTHQAFRVKQGQKFFTNSGFASMGWGLPAAIGACIAHGKERVVCIAGEGGLQMTIQELATVMYHRLPIKLFVYNNGGYLTIKQSQQAGCEGRLMGCNQETGLSFPDMVKLAAAYDIPAIRLDHQERLRARVERVIDAPGPMICELVMDPDQPQVPRAIPRYGSDGKSVQTPLEDLYPFLDREELAENMIAEQGKGGESCQSVR
jgi:acetolactate synthase-1/2/3 large subunit